MASKAQKKTCTKCGGTFPVAEFYKDKSQKDGRASWCKACERAYNKAYFASLKKVEAPKKAAISDAKSLAKFETGMKGERVNRKSNDGTRTNAAKARTVARANAKKASPKRTASKKA